jgi:hypothetical protein
MKAALLLIALAAQLAPERMTLAQEHGTVPRAPALDVAAPAAAAGPTARPSEETIRAAVRAVVAERPANPRLHEADTLRANSYEVFARKVDAATVPDCLHADGLKWQPTFFLGGWIALPFVAVAKIRGVCQ